MPYHTHQNRRNPRGVFRMLWLCASAIQQQSRQARRHRHARGRPSTERKTPTHHPWEFERGDQRPQGLFRRGRVGMTTPPSVVDGCAEPSVDGMAPQESGAIVWRHRLRRRWARLAPFPGRHSCGLGHQPNKANFIVAKRQTKQGGNPPFCSAPLRKE